MESQWKSLSCMHFQVLQEKKDEYRNVLCSFLTEKENESISHLCNAADVSEKLFWNMLKKSQEVGRKSSCFIVNDEIISGDNAIIEMWANHLKNLECQAFIQCSMITSGLLLNMKSKRF